MPDIICLQGKIRMGDPCWTLEAEAESLALLGDLSGVSDGDEVYVCGREAEASFCGAERALMVTWISREYGGGESPPRKVTRKVGVKVTLSSRDGTPVFRLEEKDLRLDAVGRHWIGEYEDVVVDGKLDVFFMSKGWVGQEFTLNVEASDPDKPEKKWKKEYKKTVIKDHVVIDQRLDVGAAK